MGIYIDLGGDRLKYLSIQTIVELKGDHSWCFSKVFNIMFIAQSHNATIHYDFKLEP